MDNPVCVMMALLVFLMDSWDLGVFISRRTEEFPRPKKELFCYSAQRTGWHLEKCSERMGSTTFTITTAQRDIERRRPQRQLRRRRRQTLIRDDRKTALRPIRHHGTNGNELLKRHIKADIYGKGRYGKNTDLGIMGRIRACWQGCEAIPKE